MKAKELRQYSKNELNNMLLKNRKKLQELRFGLSSGKVKNIRQIRMVKRDIARILTIINQISNIKDQNAEQNVR